LNRRRALKATVLATAAVGIGVVVRPRSAQAASFAHPGMLHTADDLGRIRAKLAAADPAVTAGWRRLTSNGRSQATWRPRPLATVARGGTGENYAQFYLDVHAAYQNALRWRISGETAHADTARETLNAWSATLTALTGNADRFLAAGLYGYQFANAAELLRGYVGFDLGRAQDLLRRVFLPMNEDFLTHHNGACISNYWANWDLCTMASLMAIGILCDDRKLFDRAVDYFKNGAGNGAVRNAVPVRYDGGLGQWQESGRDQGHSVMGVGLMATLCEMAWNQGVDLYGYDDSRFLAGAEYVARYNLGLDVPFTVYRWGQGTSCARREQTVVAAASRGHVRPVWEMIYNHYVVRKGMAAPNVASMAAKLRAEGGGGDYGTGSGGFDQLGFGTLLYTRDAVAAPSAATSTSPSARTGATGRAGLDEAPNPAGPDSAAPARPASGAQNGRSGLVGGWVGGGALAAAALGGLLVLRRRRGD